MKILNQQEVAGVVGAEHMAWQPATLVETCDGFSCRSVFTDGYYYQVSTTEEVVYGTIKIAVSAVLFALSAVLISTTFKK